MDPESGWEYSIGPRGARLVPISKRAGPGCLTEAFPVGCLGGAGTLGRILARYLFREILVGKDPLDRLEVTRGVNEPLVYCSEGEGATKQELWRGFDRGTGKGGIF